MVGQLYLNNDAHYILKSEKTNLEYDISEKLDEMLEQLVSIRITNKNEILFNRKGLLLKIWQGGVLKYALVDEKLGLHIFDDVLWELVDSEVNFRVKAIDKEDI